MRTCSTCRETKELTEVNRHHKRNTYDSLCRSCRSAYSRAYYARNREAVRKTQERWRGANWDRVPELSLESTSRRRAWKAAAELDLPRAYRKALFAFYGNRCAACGSTERLTHDHVVPLAQGGGHTWRNSQVLCHSCDSRKQDAHTTDFRDWAEGVLYGVAEGRPVVVYDSFRPAPVLP